MIAVHFGRRKARFATLGLAAGICALAVVGTAVWSGRVSASASAPQTWLPGQCIPQFMTPLPVFGPGYNAALPRIDAAAHPFLTVAMKQASQQVLPGTIRSSDPGCPANISIGETTVWAYETTDSVTGQVLGPAHWPAVTVETRRYIPTLVTYVNQLPHGTGSLQELIAVDKTIHWADPEHVGMMNPCMDMGAGMAPGCDRPYNGPVPAVPHLHGAEVPSAFDGGPEAWFTPTGLKGPGYSSLFHVGAGKAVYLYDNAQEPGTLWFHDHALGATRTNVYSGLAAFYFLRDPLAEPRNLPSGAYEVEMAIQDRQFDQNGQLYFPDGSGDPNSNLNGTPPNPDVHPTWNPEFAGDVVVVNGAPWPFFKVEPRRYRFRIVNGSNARVWNLTFGKAPVYAIGSDDAYLDAPVPQSTVFIAPGERADIIVDFTSLAGKKITVTNDAPVPYPDGLWPVDHRDPDDPAVVLAADQPQMAQVMRFDVTEPRHGNDSSCNPAARGCMRPVETVRLTDGAGNIARGVKIDRVRQLVLKEHEGAGGPLEVLVNNTRWDGMRSAGVAADFAASSGITELPRVGSTELWEVINLTMDAHPIHTHLSQFQILNRQDYDPAYGDAWAAAFPSGCFQPGNEADNPCPGYGPPNPYGKKNGDKAVGGNPALSPFLVGTPSAPGAWESGWKDTAKAHPGQVLRILVRWAPTGTPVHFARAGVNWYPFDPTAGPGYVWHCHIIDHEDNEMMRPYKVVR
jgi:spore coat protein A, manganese oxidase